jgi:hypothetical protein
MRSPAPEIIYDNRRNGATLCVCDEALKRQSAAGSGVVMQEWRNVKNQRFCGNNLVAPCVVVRSGVDVKGETVLQQPNDTYTAGIWNQPASMLEGSLSQVRSLAIRILALPLVGNKIITRLEQIVSLQ